jgi:hypothetical protein
MQQELVSERKRLLVGSMDASGIHPAYNMYGETGDRNRKEEEELALEDKQNEGFPQLVPRLFSIEHSMSRTSRCGKQHGREAVEMEVERCRDVQAFRKLGRSELANLRLKPPSCSRPSSGSLRLRPESVVSTAQTPSDLSCCPVWVRQ